MNTTQVFLHALEEEWDPDVRAGNPLGFPGYEPPPEESVVTGRTGLGYVLVQGRFDVLGGSMGAAHGERAVRAYRRAAAERRPVVVVASSGGARLQEGMVSLIQMARTAAAAAEHAAAGLLQVAVLRSPTTGGVYASYASLADIRAAEPGATIGFAGPRVVELTTGQRVPSDSHTAESAYGAGLVDALVPPEAQAAWVEAALGLRDVPWHHPGWVGHAVGEPSPGAWGEVQRARAPHRPPADALAARMCSSWVPLHGGGAAVRAALASFEGQRLGVIATTRARPAVADYRLARRLIALTARLGLPLLTIVDTSGADPGPASEAAGVAGEIARTLAAMAAFPNPSVSICSGEGGSGGALAFAFSDRLLMLEHAVFEVIAPEGAAAILDRTPDTAAARAQDLKLTSADLSALGVVDAVVAEEDSAIRAAIAAALRQAVAGDRHRRFDDATRRSLA